MEISEQNITVQGARVYYQTCGARGKQTLLFFHGWPGYLLEKSGVLQTLAQYFFVIAPAHPGLRKSDPLPTYEDIFKQYAVVAHHIVEKEGCDREQIIVMGQSFGGGVASAYVEHYPETTRALILTDSTMGASRRDWWSHALFGYGGMLISVLPYLPRFLQRKILFMVYGVTVDDKNTWPSVEKTFPNRIAMVQNFTAILNQSKNSGVMVIDRPYGDFPILFLWGDRDGKEFNMYGYCPVDDADALYKKLKKQGRNIQFTTVHGGHTILYRQPI